LYSSRSFQLKAGRFLSGNRERETRKRETVLCTGLPLLKKNTDSAALEKRLWDAADQFRANSGLKAQACVTEGFNENDVMPFSSGGMDA
jgi:hypothetical protein